MTRSMIKYDQWFSFSIIVLTLAQGKELLWLILMLFITSNSFLDVTNRNLPGSRNIWGFQLASLTKSRKTSSTHVILILTDGPSWLLVSKINNMSLRRIAHTSNMQSEIMTQKKRVQFQNFASTKPIDSNFLNIEKLKEHPPPSKKSIFLMDVFPLPHKCMMIISEPLLRFNKEKNS